jgi:hypothetical protein
MLESIFERRSGQSSFSRDFVFGAELGSAFVLGAVSMAAFLRRREIVEAILQAQQKAQKVISGGGSWVQNKRQEIMRSEPNEEAREEELVGTRLN